MFSLVEEREEGIGMSLLEGLLGCRIEYYKIVKDYSHPSFKVKVAKSDAVGAITTGRANGCYVDVWVNASAFNRGGFRTWREWWYGIGTCM